MNNVHLVTVIYALKNLLHAVTVMHTQPHTHRHNTE